MSQDNPTEKRIETGLTAADIMGTATPKAEENKARCPYCKKVNPVFGSHVCGHSATAILVALCCESCHTVISLQTIPMPVEISPEPEKKKGPKIWRP